MTLRILACRPVEWPSTGPLADAEPTPVYDGSIIESCAKCEQSIHVGPTQQKTDGDRYCFWCAVIVAEGRATVVNLGNPEGDL